MKVEILDTTLRDGAQHRQVSYSSVDKLDVIAALDRLGVHYTEYGAPGFDPAAEKLSRLTLPVTRSVPVAFGMTCKKGLMPDRDENLRALVECPTPTLTLVGKSHALQVRDVLKTDLDENLRIIEQSVAYATKNDKTVIFDAEHFFDGYRYDAEYAVKTLAAAVRGGAKVLTLCDTNGGALPDDVKEITARIVERFPEVRIGIHCHNDNGLAVASTLAAVKAGATHVQGTLLGIGERCGNANLSTLLPLLVREGYTVGIDLKLLTPVARTVAEITNITIPDFYPYVGAGAFAHKAGLHADGMLKAGGSFEHVDPASVGNIRQLLLSKEAGKHLLIAKLKPFFPDIAENAEGLKRIARALKEREDAGYTYEAAEASFVILAGKILDRDVTRFEPIGYSVTNTSDEPECTASTTIRVGDVTRSASAKGLGPVHALDKAMRECMLNFFPSIDKVSLIDYKVRVINPRSATGAAVRVLITTTDGRHIWKTVGVSEDIIRASFDALSDSYHFALSDDFDFYFG